MDYVDEIKRLAGIDTFSGQKEYHHDTRTSSEKKMIEHKNNIKPGTEEWFDLWFCNHTTTNYTPGFRGRRK